MAKVKSKPKPTDQEALFLIHMRRERAKGVMNEILHAINRTIKMPNPEQILEYLTNMCMCLELMLKLLSDDWRTHDVARMFEVVIEAPHPNPAFMESLKNAILKPEVPSLACGRNH